MKESQIGLRRSIDPLRTHSAGRTTAVVFSEVGLEAESTRVNLSFVDDFFVNRFIVRCSTGSPKKIIVTSLKDTLPSKDEGCGPTPAERGGLGRP